MGSHRTYEAGTPSWVDLGTPDVAAISVWQPGDHKGADVVNEPGSLTWNELACRDVDGAKALYGAVFGWSGETELPTGRVSVLNDPYGAVFSIITLSQPPTG